MSVAGRNAVHGSTMTFYRPTVAAGTGGQVTTTWAATRYDTRLELHQLTDERLRQIFGVDSRVDLVAFDAANVNVEPLDACVVSAGPFTGATFRVVRTRRSRKYLEIGLRQTDETVP